MIKAVIFDFDGTLSNRQENAYLTYDHMLRPYFEDLSDIEYEAVLQDMMLYDGNGNLRTEYRLDTFMRKYKDRISEEDRDRLAAYYGKHMYEYTRLKDETIEVLEALYGNYKLGLLSNGDPFSQRSKIDHVGVSKYFDEVIVSGDLTCKKPQKEIFDLMAERLGVNNEECMMVGDVFSTDILGAIRAGMIPCWIVMNPETTSKFYDGHRISNLREIITILNTQS